MREMREQMSDISDVGAKAQGVAAPVSTVVAAPDTGMEPPNQEEQSIEERREQAARRRREEMRAAIDQAVAAERARWQAYGETPAVPQADTARQTAEDLEDMDTVPETSQAFYEEVFGLPGAEAAAAAPAPEEGAAAPAALMQVYGQVQELIRERSRDELRRQFDRLQAFDPTVESLEGLLAGAHSAEFGQNFAATGDLLKAYKLTYFDALRERSQRSAQLQRSYSTQSRAHLRRSAVHGSGAPQLTGAIVDAYRAIDPDVSIEEIRRYEAKYHGRNPRET